MTDRRTPPTVKNALSNYAWRRAVKMHMNSIYTCRCLCHCWVIWKKHFAIFSVLIHRNMDLVRFIGRLQRAKCISTLCSIVTGADITQNATSVLLFCHHKIRINTVIKNNSLTNGYFKRPVNWMQAATAVCLLRAVLQSLDGDRVECCQKKSELSRSDCTAVFAHSRW